MNRVCIIIFVGMAANSCVLVDMYSPEEVMAYSSSAYEGQDEVDFIVNEEISLQEDLIYYSGDGSEPEQKSALVCISVCARSSSNEYGHTVQVKSVELGGMLEGEHFYRNGTFNLIDGQWISKYADDGNPLTFTIDDEYFNETASALPDDYAPLTDEDSYIRIIPQDFSEVGLAVTVKYSIMEGEEVLLDDTFSFRLDADFTQGGTFSILMDLTPAPIGFNPIIEPWEPEEIIEIFI